MSSIRWCCAAIFREIRHSLKLMRRTRETAFAAYTHQDLPFERLMQAINPNRDVRHSSLFQVLFVLQNAPVHIPPLPNLTPRLLLDSHNGTAKFDLTIGLTEMPEGLVGILEYNTRLIRCGHDRADGSAFPPAAGIHGRRRPSHAH